MADIASFKRFMDRLDIPDPTTEFEEWVRNYILYDSVTLQGMLRGIIVDLSEASMKLTGEATFLELDLDMEFNMQDEDLLYWLDNRSRREAELIQGVSDESVIQNLWKVVYDGKYSIDKAAESLMGEFAFSENRARVIARTEIISAGRSGQYFADSQSGIVIGKKWMAAHQKDRTRKGHQEADGQVVAFDKPFLVENADGEQEELMFPGDTSLGATASNVIQCRCWYKRILEGEELK